MQYIISKVSSMVKTYLVGKSMVVLLDHLELIGKVPILLHTEEMRRTLFCRTVGVEIILGKVKKLEVMYHSINSNKGMNSTR